MLRNFATVFATLVLAAGWAFFYWQSRAVDLTAAHGAFGVLRELRELDQRWNDRLVGSRAPPVLARPATLPPAPTVAIGSRLARLEGYALSFNTPVAGGEISALKRALDEKADKVARFSAAYNDFSAASSAFKAAREDLQLLARERGLSAREGLPGGLARELETIGDRVQAFAMQPVAGEAARIDGLIAAARGASLGEAVATRVEQFLATAGKATEQRAFAEAFFEEAWLGSTGPRIDTVARSFERAFGDAIDENDAYRVFLLYHSGILVAILVWLVWSLAVRRAELDAANRRLTEANESLEARVDERTRDLSQAMTKLKESEAMLIQSEKMSSLGQMVAGIAHEVNTPLAYVKASLESVGGALAGGRRVAEGSDALLGLLAAEAADPAKLATQFNVVRQAVDALRNKGALASAEKSVTDGLYGIGQISEIVANLKNFSRIDRNQVAEFDVHDGLNATIRIAQSQIQDRTVHREFGELPRIACAASQINQVFLNLIANAAQATDPKNGVITIRTAPRGVERVSVEVIDNGSGIPAEVLPKIFDPFFTTKEVGKGTGLGLSICYKIIQAHGGSIDVQSKPGAGTRFTVVLPVKPGVAGAPSAVQSGMQSPAPSSAPSSS